MTIEHISQHFPKQYDKNKVLQIPTQHKNRQFKSFRLLPFQNSEKYQHREQFTLKMLKSQYVMSCYPPPLCHTSLESSYDWSSLMFMMKFIFFLLCLKGGLWAVQKPVYQSHHRLPVVSSFINDIIFRPIFFNKKIYFFFLLGRSFLTKIHIFCWNVSA